MARDALGTKITLYPSFSIDFFIRNFILNYQYPPTLDETAVAFNITKKAISDHLKAIMNKKYLYMQKYSARSIALKDYHIELVQNDTEK